MYSVLKGDKKKDDTELRPEIRTYVYNHIMNTVKVLRRAIAVGITYSWNKSYLYSKEVKVLGAYCGEEGRSC
jgi:hypothetical protein